jgi:hypothetical protein
MTEFELGYCIGLIVGEGGFSGDGKGRAGFRLVVRMSADDPEPVHFLQGMLGGIVYGPYDHGGRHYYHWALTGRRLLPIASLLLDRMPPCRKRRQLEEWVDRLGCFLQQEIGFDNP